MNRGTIDVASSSQSWPRNSEGIHELDVVVLLQPSSTPGMAGNRRVQLCASSTWSWLAPGPAFVQGSLHGDGDGEQEVGRRWWMS